MSTRKVDFNKVDRAIRAQLKAFALGEIRAEDALLRIDIILHMETGKESELKEVIQARFTPGGAVQA